MHNTMERNTLKAKTLQSLRINNSTLPTANDKRHTPPERRTNFVVLGGGSAAATGFGRKTVLFSHEK